MDVRIWTWTVLNLVVIYIVVNADNMWIYVMETQKGQSRKILSLGFQKSTHFTRKCGRVFQVQEKVLLVLRICL